MKKSQRAWHLVDVKTGEKTSGSAFQPPVASFFYPPYSLEIDLGF